MEKQQDSYSNQTSSSPNQASDAISYEDRASKINSDITEAIKESPGYTIVKSKNSVLYYDALTIGLTETHNIPELIVNGHYPDDFVVSLIRGVVEACSKDRTLLDREAFVLNGKKFGKEIKIPVGLKTITDVEKCYYMHLAVHRYGKDGFTAKQIVLSDSNGFLPWNPIYSGSSQWFLYVHCRKCHKTDNVKFLCSKCKYVRYCDSECQKADWPSHKQVCSNAKSYREEISKI